MSNVTQKEINTEMVWTKKKGLKYVILVYAEMTERTLNVLAHASFGC